MNGVRAGALPLLLVAMLPPSAARAEVRLFNGTSLAGWTVISAKAADGQPKAEDQFRVEDGAIRLVGGRRCYLRTDGRYENFRLRLEWRWIDRDPEHDQFSGIFLRMAEPDGNVFPRNYQVEIASTKAATGSGDVYVMGYDRASFHTDPARNKDAAMPTRPGVTGSLGLRERGRNAELPRGEWNRYDIRFDRDHLTVRLNGKLVNQATGALRAAGPIGLQCEGSAIAFRDIRLDPIVR